MLANGAAHAALHDRVTPVDRGDIATGADCLDDRLYPVLQLPRQAHFEGSRGVAEISERGRGVLGRGPQGDEIGPENYPTASIPIRTPRDVFERMWPYEREPAEVFWLLALDAQHRLIGGAPEAITRGILNSSLVHPREVFCAAIVSRAASVILCHNHPSGDPTPSADDRAVTRQLVDAGRLLDIPVDDHVILGKEAYLSFAERGLLG